MISSDFPRFLRPRFLSCGRIVRYLIIWRIFISKSYDKTMIIGLKLYFFFFTAQLKRCGNFFIIKMFPIIRVFRHYFSKNFPLKCIDTKNPSKIFDFTPKLIHFLSMRRDRDEPRISRYIQKFIDIAFNRLCIDNPKSRSIRIFALNYGELLTNIKHWNIFCFRNMLIFPFGRTLLWLYQHFVRTKGAST